MNASVKKLLLALAIPLGVGGLSALLSFSPGSFRAMRMPPLSPPGWAFPVVWTALYLLMGYGSYLVYLSDVPPDDKFRALTLYGVQLGLNFLWPLLFFRWGLLLWAFFELLLLWLAVALTVGAFHRIRRLAGTLLLPYLLWVTFAGYLNYGAFLLN